MKASTVDTAKKRTTRPPKGNGALPSVHEEPLDRRALLAALTAVADGDFSVRLPGDWTGLDGKIADRFNEIVSANQMMARELARVGQVVGRQGKTRQRMSFSRNAGAWGEMQVSLNTLMDDLVRPITDLTSAVTAVAQGTLVQTVRLDVEGRPLEGEFLRSATIVNTMIKQLSVFTSEVTRVAREVGTDGKLGGQAQVPEVSGVWKDLTESVNNMASNLTAQVRNISEVTIAVANGDLSRKITVDVRGEILQLKEAINTMVDQLRSFASEVTRVAREVGTEGRLGGQAVVPGVAGTWKDLTDNVNLLAANLTTQVRNIAEVTTAVARGDLSRKITVDVSGEVLELKNTINTMVDQLNAFASEVTRVAREVGTEGKLGGQAQVPGVGGTWKDLTDNVNFMASNLTGQVRNIAEVATAIANGDLSKKITVNVSGEILQLKETLNTMVDQLNAFASEVIRVSREVGTEGRLGGQAVVPGVVGTWKDLTDNTNLLAANLTTQVRNIAEVTTAVARGDLSRKITVDVSGEVLELKDTINTMVDQLNAFASEVTRVAREVGTEGKLGGQAQVPGVAGTWKDLTDSVNSMASNLTAQVRNIAEVATAVARGDLSRKIAVDVKGEILALKNTLNTMVDQLNAFASEVTRVAREVGTEGKLGGQATVPGVAGTWKDLTDNVNLLAANLTTQVRNIADVTTAIANGDLSKKIAADASGEVLELKNTINTMVDQLNAFASEVTRVAREVGTEGKLGGQAQVSGVAGTWKGLTDNVNSMAGNLTGQVRNIAEVTTAVARGDLSRKITVDVKGEILELKNTINTMVDQLNAFASEVTRVAREVGTEGKLGGQAQVPGVGGTWKDLTDNVNFMASNLTAQVRGIAEVATAIAAGDLSRKITVDVRGEILLVKETMNTMVEQLRAFASEVIRVSREVGTEGKLGGQAVVPGVAGTWKDLTDNVNLLAANLTTQVRNIAEVTTAVARGDLSRKITVDVSGEILELKNTINTMVDQLNAFASEVTRVAREVGTEGKLGGQAQVPGVGGTWKDLTDTVNVMAANLTEQVRGIVKVVTAVAEGDLKQNLFVQSKGEVAALADTINDMTKTLAIFADQVTTVAREVGVEGRLGGQANVPGASGTWKDLTGNVNLLAANLTTQVRAIAEVATAVTKGDLTRSIQVDARGEVADLKDNINTMIDNLRLTTDRNNEQDWLKTNLNRFTGMLQGQRDLATVGRLLLSELAPLVNAHQGLIYQLADDGGTVHLRMLASYASSPHQPYPARVEMGQGFIGQCAVDKRRIIVTNVPRDTIAVGPAFFNALPRSVAVFPVVFEGKIKAVLALASLVELAPSHLGFLEQLTANLGIVLNSIEVTMQTEELLKQSQKLAAELTTQQTELQQTNEQLGQKAQQLAEQNAEVERKNREIEQARRALEEKASELALTSKYKSEFLANMSHELRTPLNSILILGQQLGDNPEHNLTAKQVEYARTIHSAGTDLLNLITDILDLSKIESGTVTVDAEDVLFSDVITTVSRTFKLEAERRRLDFDVEFDPNLPRRIVTDSKRLMQVLKNLLSNAFKFTAQGGVRLRVAQAVGGWTREHAILGSSTDVVCFEVTDTGIGIPPEKQKLIFEAFQQADAGTSRKYGGTGLGLAISRELAGLLGGEIVLQSTPGTGSTFSLYLPLAYSGDVVGDSVAISTADGVEQARPRPTIQAMRRTEPSHVVDSRRSREPVARRPDHAHRGGRSELCARDRRPRPLERLQGPRGHDGRGRARARSRVPPECGVARRVPARHARMDRALAAQARPGHAPHPGPDRHSRRRPSARPGPRRLLVCGQAHDTRRAQQRAVAHQGVRGAASQAPARGRRQSARAVEHHGASGARRHRHHDRANGHGGAHRFARAALRLRSARPAAAGHVGLRRAGGHPRRGRVTRPAGGGLYRQGADGRGGCAPADARAERRRQGGGVSRPAARRNGTVLASHRGRPAGGQARDARAASRVGRGPHRQERAGGRRRRAQHLRAVERPREAGHERAHREHGARGDRDAGSYVRRRHRADGHHDAGDGRVRDDARDPPGGQVPPPADHRAHREGDDGRPRQVPAGGRVRLPRQARQHGAAHFGAPHVAPQVVVMNPHARFARCPQRGRSSRSGAALRANGSTP